MYRCISKLTLCFVLTFWLGFQADLVHAATATITPAARDFGNVTIGSNSTQVFTLTYTGVAAGALTVTSATVSAAPFTKIFDGCTGISIASPGLSCSITVQFSPTAVATSTGTLTLVTNATDGTTKISSLIGAGTTGPSVTASLTPTTYAFGSVSLGSISSNIFTITNTGGSANLTVASATVAAPFTKTADNCSGTSLPLAGTCTIEVSYVPTALVTSVGLLSVVTNATDGTTKIATLTGSGIAGPSVTGSVSPASFNYGNVTIGSNTSTTFIITNTGGSVNLNITSATVSALPFLKTADTCTGTSLPLLASCTVEVTYFPSASAVSLGTLTIVTNATDGTSKIATLVGTGIVGASATGTITPASYAFGNVSIGTPSTGAFVLQNTGGSVNLTIASATVSAAPFLKTADGCTGASLAISATCTIEVTYFPTALVSSAAILTVVTNATDGTNKVVSVTGTGISTANVTAGLAPASHNFGSVEIGGNASQAFTVTNSGGSGNLTIGAVTLSAGPFVLNSDTCSGASLAVSDTCTLNVVFTPTLAGNYAGTLSIATNASNGNNKIASLSGATASAGTVEFSSASYAFNNNVKTATIYVLRTGGTKGAASVRYTTQSGTASQQGGDYDDVSNILSWADGDASPKKIDISVHKQSFKGDNRSFSVILSFDSGKISLGTQVAAVQIFDSSKTDASTSANDDDSEQAISGGGCSITASTSRSSILPWSLALFLIVSFRRRFRRRESLGH